MDSYTKPVSLFESPQNGKLKQEVLLIKNDRGQGGICHAQKGMCILLHVTGLRCISLFCLVTKNQLSIIEPIGT